MQSEDATSRWGICTKSRKCIAERLIVSGRIGLQIDSAIGRDLGFEAGDLSGSEVVHARVVGVVHEVLNGLERNENRN